MAVDMTPEIDQWKTDLLDKIGATSAELYDAVSRWQEEPTDHRRKNIFESIGCLEALFQTLETIRGENEYQNRDI